MGTEIVRELLLEINPNLSDEKFLEIWKMCHGNPFNAPILYQILEVVNKNTLDIDADIPR